MMPGCVDLTGSKGSVASTGEYFRHMFFTTTEDALGGSPLGMVTWESAGLRVRRVGLGLFTHGGGRRSFTATLRECGALTARGIRCGATRTGCLTVSASAPCKSARATAKPPAPCKSARAISTYMYRTASIIMGPINECPEMKEWPRTGIQASGATLATLPLSLHPLQRNLVHGGFETCMDTWCIQCETSSVANWYIKSQPRTGTHANGEWV